MLEGAIITTLMTLGIPYCIKLYGLNVEMEQARRLEKDCYHCLSFANLILKLSLEKDLRAYKKASKEWVRKEEIAKKEYNNIRHDPSTSIGKAWSIFDPLAQPLNYKWRSGAIVPYQKNMQELHNNMIMNKDWISRISDIDTSFLGWEHYGVIYQDNRVLKDKPQYNMTTYSFNVMQKKYLDLFIFSSDYLKAASDNFRQHIHILLSLPFVSNIFDSKLLIYSRKMIMQESEDLRELYEENEENITGMIKLSSLGI